MASSDVPFFLFYSVSALSIDRKNYSIDFKSHLILVEGYSYHLNCNFKQRKRMRRTHRKQKKQRGRERMDGIKKTIQKTIHSSID